MHKSATKCNETVGKWCKNKHGASKIIDTLETYQGATPIGSARLAPNDVFSTEIKAREASGIIITPIGSEFLLFKVK
jgi:hypothetical protein